MGSKIVDKNQKVKASECIEYRFLTKKKENRGVCISKNTLQV